MTSLRDRMRHTVKPRDKHDLEMQVGVILAVIWIVFVCAKLFVR